MNKLVDSMSLLKKSIEGSAYPGRNFYFKTARKSLALATFLFIVLLASGFQAHATSDLVHLAEREQIRRQENLKKAERLITRAERAQKDKNLKEAYKDYIEVLTLIPAGSATAAERQSVVNDFSKTAVAYARELIARGNYAEAENVAKTVLAPEFNPTYKPAANLLSQLEKGNFNTTLEPAFAAKRDDVAKLLNEAEGYYATGRFDLAIKRYEQVLNLDNYNIAARNGMELVNKQRTAYYDEAYNETRSRMLWEIDRVWERPVRKRSANGRSSETAQFLVQTAPASRDAILKKLNDIQLDRVDLQDVSIREAVEYLRQKSRDLDRSSEDPRSRGVNIVLRLPSAGIQPVEASLPGETTQPIAPSVNENSKITMTLRNVPMVEAIRYLTEIANLRYRVDPFAVSIVPFTENTDELFTKEYRVSPSFIPATSGTDAGPAIPGSQPVSDGNQRIKGVRNATEYLKQQGVPFPEGAFAQYIPAGSRLIVRNTQEALETVDTLVEGEMGVPPTQVEIESKFVEISQSNVNELGFDWLLGPFSIGGGVYGDGGTRVGDISTPQNYNNFPFGAIGANPVTAGNRSGFGTGAQSAITANSINALLAGVRPGQNFASPGIFGIAGVFTNPQFQMVIRALSQQRGVDLMSAPKVTTKSGFAANIRMTREFPFPTGYSPPVVPGAGGGQNTPATGIISVSTLVTPATPSSFATQDLGISMNVTPQIGADNFTIGLTLEPTVSDFDGFINYGSEVVGPTNVLPTLANNFSGVGTFVLTPNRIEQPVFSIRSVNTNVTIWDGQTVALGGLIREDVQKVNDKVPILGDIPLAGRLFRSNVDQKIKKNLIIFVSARLMDAQGQPLIQDDEAEEFVEPLGLPEDLPQPLVETRQIGK
jgi:general secretion pathway protein D